MLCIVQETKKAQAAGDVYLHGESKQMVNKRRNTKENQLTLHTAQHVHSQLRGKKIKMENQKNCISKNKQINQTIVKQNHICFVRFVFLWW